MPLTVAGLISILQISRLLHRLPEKETVVITLTMSSLTNIEVPAKLGITKRTVETHQNNIYNKLGVSNI